MLEEACPEYRGGNKMAESIRTAKSTLVDKRIDEFCQSSAELLQSIYARCGNVAKGIIPKKEKKKREK